MTDDVQAVEKKALVLWLAVLAVLLLVVPSYRYPVAIGGWLLVAVLGGPIVHALAQRRRHPR